MAAQASSTQIRVSAQNTGLWNIVQDELTAKRTGDLLEKDLALHHVFLNRKGFHDHMLHHILALYGTGANAAQVQKAFDLRHDLQRPVEPLHEDVVADLVRSWESSTKYLGNEDHYPDFLAYFQKQIDERGYESVVKEYLLNGTPSANNLLLRLHAGVLHPLIQLMYGLEWKQPAVVAEALAQTCVHGIEGLDKLLLPSERKNESTAAPMPSLLSMYERIQSSSALDGAARFEDESKIEDGIIKRALDPMMSVLQEVHVEDHELEERTAEMMHTIILVASSAAIRAPHHVKYDFFLMHHVNSAIMYLTTLQQPWLERKDKLRLLEWKIRMDLIEYVARGQPAISIQEVASYEPKIPSAASIRDIGNRLQDFGDDGHGIKQARATALCHELMKDWEDKPWAILKGDEIWTKIQHMVVDALEIPGPLYVRSAGYDKAWENIPLRETPRQSDESLRALQTGSGSSAEALASA